MVDTQYLTVLLAFTAQPVQSNGVHNNFIIGESLISSTGNYTGPPWIALPEREIWQDVTDHVVAGSITVNRGVQSQSTPWFRCDGGTASFTLDNNDGSDQFNPLNLSGPYAAAGVTQCRPGLMVKIGMSNTGTGTLAETLFVGRVDGWEPDADDKWSVVHVTAMDGIERLQACNYGALPTAQFDGDAGPTRVGRLLDRAGWPAGWRQFTVFPSTSTLQATNMAQAVWSEILLTADSDGAFVYQDKFGDIVYKRHGDVSYSPGWTFATDGSGWRISNYTTSYDKKQVYNTIKLARANGTVQTAEDTKSASIDRNGTRVHSRSDLLCSTDDQVLTLAEWLLSQTKDLAFRVETFDVDLLSGTDPVGTWSAMGQLDLTSVVSVLINTPASNTARPISTTTLGMVRGLKWTETQGGVKLTVSVTTMLNPPTSPIARPGVIAARVRTPQTFAYKT